MSNTIHFRGFDYEGPLDGLAEALRAAGFTPTSTNQSPSSSAISLGPIVRTSADDSAEETSVDINVGDDAESYRVQLRRDPEFIDRAASRLPFTQLQKHVFRTMLRMPDDEYRLRRDIAAEAGMSDSKLGATFAGMGRRFCVTENSFGVDVGLSVAMQFQGDGVGVPWTYALNPVFREWLVNHPVAIDGENGDIAR